MTNEEAINYLRGCFAPTCKICPIGCEKPDIANEARQLATEALNKQIPKKPTTELCPTCGKYGIHESDGYGNLNFCCECGQAIDWSK